MKQPQPESLAVHVRETGQNEQLLHDVVLQTPQRPARADGIAVGSFDGVAEDGTALVSIPSFGLDRIRARSISPLDAAQIGQDVALGFEANDPLRPIILGMMIASPVVTPLEAAEVLLDGERVALSATHEIELRCGDAALIMSADGRIQLRGTYITSYASATQRILGGSVNVN